MFQKEANRVARQNGYGFATDIIFEEGIDEPYIKERIDPGYRKKTTGEYVSGGCYGRYVRKDVYYQKAKTVVAFPL